MIKELMIVYEPHLLWMASSWDEIVILNSMLDNHKERNIFRSYYIPPIDCSIRDIFKLQGGRGERRAIMNRKMINFETKT